MAALVHADLTANLRVNDLPYRFSSWAFDHPRNVGLWIDGGQIEPLGVHADFRGCGLGRAMLAHSLQRLGQYGAQDVVLETDNYCSAAFGLYEAAGFRVTRDVLVYWKDYPVA